MKKGLAHLEKLRAAIFVHPATKALRVFGVAEQTFFTSAMVSERVLFRDQAFAADVASGRVHYKARLPGRRHAEA